MPDPNIRYEGLPFDEAIAYFRGKVNLPTRRWDDLWQGMHARAFVVAGAARNDLLTDLRGAIDKAIAQGTTLAQFRKDFDQIVARTGWAYNGGRNWRTRVMLGTNIKTAYAAGRYAQLKEVQAARPYWKYVHGDSAVPRPQHLAWNGLVLPADDPWWDTHYPPNGWGCSCKVFAVGSRDLAKMGKSGPDTAPRDGTWAWTDKAGHAHTVPNGIDAGWAYNVGEAAWGRAQAAQAAAAEAGGSDRLTPGDWRSAGRPPKIPLDAARAQLGKRAESKEELKARIREIIGGDNKVFSFVAAGFRYDILVDAAVLAGHLPLDRSSFLPLLTETLEHPFEVWMSFERSRKNGEVVLRQRVVKAFDLGGRSMLVVANAMEGAMTAWTVMPVRNQKYIDQQRVGSLLWGR